MEKLTLKRAAALFLALVLVFALLPSAAFAAGGDGTDPTDPVDPTDPTDPDPTPTDPNDQPAIVFSEDIQNNGLVLTLGTSVTLKVGTGGAADDDVSFLNMPAGTTYEWKSADTARFIVAATNAASGAPTLSPLTSTSGSDRVRLTVTATLGADGGTRSAECWVEVRYAAPTGITLSRTMGEINVGEGLTISATLAPANVCDTSAIVWGLNEAGEGAVAGADILTPSYAKGPTVTFVGRRPGDATIIATAGEKTAVCLVTVTGLLINRTLSSGAVVEVSDQEITIPIGSELQLEAVPVGSRFTGTVASWRSSSQGVAFVNAVTGKITAQALGSTQITVSQGDYTASCTVRVVENTASAVNVNMTNTESLKLYSLLSSLNTVYQQAMELADVRASSISYLTNLSVATSEGVLYYNYVSPENHGYGVGVSELYYVTPPTGQRGLADVTFVPNQAFTGTAIISYTGYDANRNSFSGTIRVAVSGSNSVAYTTGQNTPVTFSADDFNDVYRRETGRDIKYLSFDLPNSTQGTLYYNYIGTGQYASLVAATEQYYRSSSPYLDRVTFVPAQGYSGSVRIAYHVVDTAGIYSTHYVTVTVTNQDQSGAGEIRYTAQKGERVSFQVTDFNDACQAALGETLDYLYFTPPSLSLGTLWHNYGGTWSVHQVSANTRYYRSSSTAAVGLVSFLPAANTVGTVTIPYTAYGTGGNRFTGTVTIKYNDIGQGEVPYSTRAGQAAQFNAADFNEICLATSGESFSYLRFDSLPSAYQGTLYYNYNGYSYYYGTQATVTTNFYRSGGYPQLSTVAFVPAATYSGTVSIPFTAYNASGTRIFSGTVNIQVEGIGDAAVRYNAYRGKPLKFNGDDFNRACQAATGRDLNYVQFQLPTSGQGTLYYNYNASSSYNSQVSTYSNYYRSSTYSQTIGNVTFLPAANGTVTLTYTGTNVSGTRYTGTIIIQVSEPQARTISYAGDSLPIGFNAAGFYQASSDVLSGGLSYIQFTNLPTAVQGTLYWNYASPGSKGTKVTIGSRYYYSASPNISQLTFVPKAGYTGQITLSYSAYSSSGVQVPGTLNIAVVSQGSTSRFSDMGVFGWAAASVDFLNDAGVAYGIGGSSFGPGLTMSRADYVVMLCRTFGFTSGNTYSFPDVATTEYYSQALAAAKERGVATADSNGRFRPFEGVTRQDAMVMLKQAMIAAGLSVTDGSYADLAGYADASSVDSYARDAVGAMVKLGVIYGNDAGQLNPKSTLSRAEMAVILHRAITLP